MFLVKFYVKLAQVQLFISKRRDTKKLESIHLILLWSQCFGSSFCHAFEHNSVRSWCYVKFKECIVFLVKFYVKVAQVQLFISKTRDTKTLEISR